MLSLQCIFFFFISNTKREKLNIFVNGIKNCTKTYYFFTHLKSCHVMEFKFNEYTFHFKLPLINIASKTCSSSLTVTSK